MTEPTIETIIAAIRETTAKATPGKWTTERPSGDVGGFARGVTIAAVIGGARIYADPPGGQFPAADREHIAACSPANMAKVLAHVDEATETIEAYKTGLAMAEERAEKAELECRDCIDTLREDVGDAEGRLVACRVARERAERELDTALANAAAIRAQADEVAKERDDAREECLRHLKSCAEVTEDAAALRADVARLREALTKAREMAAEYVESGCGDPSTAPEIIEIDAALAGFAPSPDPRDATIAQLRLLLRTAADSLSGPHPVLRTEINEALAGSAPATPEPPEPRRLAADEQSAMKRALRGSVTKKDVGAPRDRTDEWDFRPLSEKLELEEVERRDIDEARDGH